MRLVNGISAYLEYQFQCGKGKLFSEKYLAEPIGNILQSAFDYQVFAEYNHPYIKNISNKGRPIQIDFVGLDENDKIVVALETKWFGKRELDNEEWLWDCYRLALISAENPDSLCLLIASGINNIEMTSKLIRLQGEKYKNIKINSRDIRGKIIKDKLVNYNINIDIKSIMVFPPHLAQSGKSGNSWKTYSWLIQSSKK